MRVSYSDLVSQLIMISFDGDAVEQYQNNVYCVRNVPFFLPLLFFHLFALRGTEGIFEVLVFDRSL